MPPNLQPLIQELYSGMDYGVVNLTIKVHDKLLNSVDATKSYSYKTKDSAEALAVVTTLIKGIGHSKDDKALTFTINFVNGKADRILVQDIKRYNYNKTVL